MVTVAEHLAGIRNASVLDLDELCRLARSAAHDVLTYFSRGHFLVFDRGDGHLDAACHVDDRATIDLLVVDPSVHDPSVEQRMVGVAHALCDAYPVDTARATSGRRWRGRR